MIKNKILSGTKFLVAEALANLLVFFVLCFIVLIFQTVRKHGWEDFLIFPIVITLGIFMVKGLSGYYLMLGVYKYFSKAQFTSSNKKVVLAFIVIFFLNIVVFLSVESLSTAINMSPDGLMFKGHHFLRRMDNILSFLFLTPMVILVFGALSTNLLGLYLYTKFNLKTKTQCV